MYLGRSLRIQILRAELGVSELGNFSFMSVSLIRYSFAADGVRLLGPTHHTEDLRTQKTAAMPSVFDGLSSLITRDTFHRGVREAIYGHVDIAASSRGLKPRLSHA